MAAVKNVALFVHRWMGVSLCALFLLWFPSGIGMMYCRYPEVTAADRLAHSPPIARGSVHLSPLDAAEKAGLAPPSEIRLNTFDGRPAYRFGFGGRSAAVVYADTGERQTDVDGELLNRVASAWAGRPESDARVRQLTDVDQWTIPTYRANAPLTKYSWPGGDEVYVSSLSGEVVQATTRASRVGAYLGPIPHWLYFTPLRKHVPTWTRVVVWSSGLATAASLLGIVVGVWMYSPSKRYQLEGRPSRIPYRGPKRWHMVLGLLFGVAATTWAFSGLLSMDPFPARASGAASSGDRVSATAIAQALAGDLPVASFAAESPRAALEKLAGLDVRELEWTSFAGEPIYLATLAGGATRIVPLDGPARHEIGHERIADTLRKAVDVQAVREMRVLDQYDFYYLDRRRTRPLPVVLVAMNDANSTRYYVDPKTGRIAGTYSSRNWVNRWAYHALHSLDFPWLYNYRPAWDIVMIAFMLGGTALSFTSCLLAWRVVGRRIRREVVLVKTSERT